MPYNSNERLEREARESLVASDLSAKMKQWRDPKPPPNGGENGASPLRILLVLLVLGGSSLAVLAVSAPLRQEQPAALPIPPQSPAQQAAEPDHEPIAQNTAPSSNRYLALAQSHYQAPDFASEIRGTAPTSQDLLNDARSALSERRYADALHALQNVPTEYKSDASYLRGHALFGLKKYAQASVLFGQLTGSVRYGEAAQWYEILSLLADMEQNKSLVLKKLKRIVEDQGHTFYREAEALLNVVNRKI